MECVIAGDSRLITISTSAIWFVSDGDGKCHAPHQTAVAGLTALGVVVPDLAPGISPEREVSVLTDGICCHSTDIERIALVPFVASIGDGIAGERSLLDAAPCGTQCQVSVVGDGPCGLPVRGLVQVS